jgi:hypothetical protein
MWSLSFALLLSLRLAGVTRAVYTLEEVQVQINSYLNRNTTQADAGCALAVCNPPETLQVSCWLTDPFASATS